MQIVQEIIKLIMIRSICLLTYSFLFIIFLPGLNAGFLTTAVQSYYNIDWTDDDALSIVSGESGEYATTPAVCTKMRCK